MNSIQPSPYGIYGALGANTASNRLRFLNDLYGALTPIQSVLDKSLWLKAFETARSKNPFSECLFKRDYPVLIFLAIKLNHPSFQNTLTNQDPDTTWQALQIG